MEERIASSNHGHDHDLDRALVPSSATDPDQVLVIQIPKDQIYRIPPPENALIVERHRTPANNSKARRNRPRTCCCCSWWTCLCLYLVFSVLVAFIVMFRLLPNKMALVFLPHDPVIRINNFSAKNLTHPSGLQYDITLSGENPNALMGISYKEDGIVSLHYKDKEIAQGKYPSFDKEGHGKISNVKLTLEGLAVAPPEDIQKSMTNPKSKARLPFSLEMHVPVKMKIGVLESGTLKFIISCNFVVDTLGQKNMGRILSQECDIERTQS